MPSWRKLSAIKVPRIRTRIYIIFLKYILNYKVSQCATMVFQVVYKAYITSLFWTQNHRDIPFEVRYGNVELAINYLLEDIMILLSLHPLSVNNHHHSRAISIWNLFWSKGLITVRQRMHFQFLYYTCLDIKKRSLKILLPLLNPIENEHRRFNCLAAILEKSRFPAHGRFNTGKF